MKMTSRMVALGLALALGLTVVACAPSEPEVQATPAAKAGNTPAATEAAAAPAATPGAAQATTAEATGTPAVAGARGTPSAVNQTPTTGLPGPVATTPAGGVTSRPGTETIATPAATPGIAEPGGAQRTDAEALLDDIDSFNERLDNLTGGGILPFVGDPPRPTDLTSMTQQARTILAGLEREFPQMSEAQRGEALRGMSDALARMALVVRNYAELTGRAAVVGTPPPGIAGIPEPGGTPAADTPWAATPGIGGIPGRPGGTPGPAPMSDEEMDEQLQQIEAEVQALSGEQPDPARVYAVLVRMQRVVDAMSAEPSQVEPSDFQSLVRAMSELERVMEDLAQSN